MNREKKLILNTGSALIYQIITITCSFVLPLYVIPYFGSEVNGLISSITQFLSIITLCECGVGAVVQSALYKPLAEKNNLKVSQILSSANKFFNGIMKVIVLYIVIMMMIYPFFIDHNNLFFYTATLVLIMAFDSIAQYYLFLPYRILLNADQVAYIQLLTHCVVIILNAISIIILIKLNFGIHAVKIVSALIFLLKPIIIKIYTQKKYKINIHETYLSEPIKQKWNGMAQHIANSVLENTDIVILTLFSNLKNVSIYGIYYLIVHGIRQIIFSLSTGFQPLIGNMLAKNEINILEKTISAVEVIFHFIVTLLFFITAILIIPFVRIYSIDFNDANYIFPAFSIFMVIAQASYCIRLPYELVIKAAGHYKETQRSSIIEAGINVLVSLVFIIILPERMKLCGVAIGTIIAMSYRTLYLVFYLSNNIINRKIKRFILNIIVDVVCIIFMLLATKNISKDSSNYLCWFVSALKNGVICLFVSGLINYMCYRKEIKALFLFKEGK